MKELTLEAVLLLREGLKYGLWLEAHWKEGVQYVGTTGKTLAEAIHEVEIGKFDPALIERGKVVSS